MTRTTIEFRKLYRDLQAEMKRRAELAESEDLAESEEVRRDTEALLRDEEPVHFYRHPLAEETERAYREQNERRERELRKSVALGLLKKRPAPPSLPVVPKVVSFRDWPAAAHPPGGPAPRGNFVWSQRFECRRSEPVLWEGRVFPLWQGFSERVFERELLRRS